MTTRAEIAAALDGVTVQHDGHAAELTGTPAQPAALAVWQAWPDWQSATWMSMCVIERTWLVYVILPAADATAWTEAADAVLEPVRAALTGVGSVSRVEPIALVAADQAVTMPAVSFTLHTN
jgi:hypothetical protein